MDYMYESPNLNGLKEGLAFIKPRNIKQKDFLDKFSSLGFTSNSTPNQMFEYIFGEEYLDEYNVLNNKILRYIKDTFSVEGRYNHKSPTLHEYKGSLVLTIDEDEIKRAIQY